MRIFTSETASRLQEILSKRFGRELTNKELEESYEALIGFAETLIDLAPEVEEPKILTNPSSFLKVPSNKQYSLNDNTQEFRNE